MRFQGFPNATTSRLHGAGLSALFLALALMISAGAAAATTLSFQPVTTTVDCTGTAAVDVMVSDVTDLRGYKLYVQFDPSIVTEAGVAVGTDFAAACTNLPAFFRYDPVNGLLRVDATLLGCSLTTTTAKSLLRITFASGATKATSALTVTGASTLRNSLNGIIGYTATAGSIANICNTAPVVTPATFSVAENSANGTPVGTVVASDIDTGDSRTFAITAGNVGGGFAIDTNSGAVTVADMAALDFETTPTFSLTVTATDNDPNTPKSGSAAITINLNNVNEAPVLGAIGNQAVNEMVQLAFTATATDVDAGSTLTFSIDSAAQALGMAITAGGGFSWTPTEAQGPGTYQATITVSDGALADVKVIDIVVSEVNLAPVLGAIGNRTVAEETQLTFTATATDNDIPVQALTYSLDAAAIAAGMLIDPGTGAFTWTPSEAQGAGTFAATVTVSDGSASDAETISITVTEVNAPPVVSDIPDQSVAEGTPFAVINLDGYVADPDHADNLLSWSATGMTSLSVSIVDRVATIMLPSADWNGSETITFTATDPGALSGADAATFTVTGVNDPPAVTNPGPQTSTVRESPTLQIVATDVDSGTLSYSALGLPNGLAINATSGEITGVIACDAASGTVQVTVTDNGTPVEATSVTFDWTINPIAAPTTLAGLAAAQDITGNGSDGTTAIGLTWTKPTDTGKTITIYRKGYGGYPLYNGAVPTLPVDGTWTPVAAGVDASLGAFTDEPPTRDFWYYTAVVANACGGASGPSALTAGTLNYHLGDVSNGTLGGQGNNLVSGADISLLGNNYGTVPTLLNNYLDIGPTTDYGIRSRPMPDNMLEFEDLIVMALNFGVVSKGIGGPEPADRNELKVFVPEQVGSDGKFVVSLWLTADGTLKGTSIPLLWNADVVNPISFERGGLVAAQVGQGMLLSPAPGTVDFALVGATDGGICGEGLLATVTFEVLKEGEAGIGLGEIRARDLENTALELDSSVILGSPEMMNVPLVSVLHQNFPNPFNPTTTFKYGVAAEGRVTIGVYDVRGRLVATLLDQIVRPGTYTVAWDGTDNDGRRVSSGVYLARFKAVDHTQLQRMTLLK